MSRSSELLKAAAAHLENGGDPFHEFLADNDVTIDECFDLADSLAMGARLIAWAMENPRQAGIAARGGADFMKMDAITRALAKINLSATA
jgi:hypothetical protein